jgi:very-short-patch-repair endonuclease
VIQVPNGYNHKLVGNSQKLRENMTREEKHLWYDFLKDLNVTVHRQKIIGNYIVDFYCPIFNFVIELDGSQHYYDDGIEKDKERDNYLKSLGIKVLRYSNLDVNKNFEGVCNDILMYMKNVIDNNLSDTLSGTSSDTSSTASGPPSPQGEG